MLFRRFAVYIKLGMREQTPFSFFMPTPVRPLAPAERAIVERLLDGLSEHYRSQARSLSVVGRCGCGKCPTIFFLPHDEGDREADLISCSGRDASGGVVGAVLLEKDGRLSQLEFFSADGHDPWGMPTVETLEPSSDA